MKTIKQLRKEKGLTQQELADALELSFATINRIESGDYEIKKVNLLALAKFFNVEVTDIKIEKVGN